MHLSKHIGCIWVLCLKQRFFFSSEILQNMNQILASPKFRVSNIDKRGRKNCFGKVKNEIENKGV